MKVLRNNVAVENVRAMEQDTGDIILPDKGMRYGEDAAVSKRRYDCEVGTVVDFGDEVSDLEKGDEVYLAPLKGIDYGGVKIYDFTEIFGVIRK